ncbi:hypothetical protein [Krasilnikoviella flava]|uniref:hypothetical protein n=1 Tax=Krasilnikoviella flava TaxID=526729 RepID=UPI0009A5E69F|nr:hypothetical protein [Krasilnikoviella flava]
MGTAPRELIGKGQSITLPRVLSGVLGFDASDQIEFDVPMIQFLGRHDCTTPTAPVERCFERVSAPSKDVLWFEHSAHLCMHEEPGRYVVVEPADPRGERPVMGRDAPVSRPTPAP